MSSELELLRNLPVSSVLDAMDQPAWLTLPGGQQHLYNQNLIDHFPLLQDGPHVQVKRIHPLDLSSLHNRYHEGMKSGQKFSLAFRMREEDQLSYSWFETTLNPVWAEGQIVAWLGMVKKIDDTAAYLDALMHSAPVGLSFMDEEYRLKAFNPTLVRDGPHSVEALQQQSFQTLAPEVFVVVKPYIDRVFETGTVATVELQSPYQETPSWWQVTYFPVQTQGGEIIGVGAISQDITGTRQAAAEVAAQKTFLQQITDEVPATIGLTDLQTNQVLFSNRYSAEVIGYTPEELRALTPEQQWGLFLPEDHPHLQETSLRIRQLPEGEMVEQEYRVKHKDGHLVWLWGRSLIFSRDEHGTPLVSLNTSVDITGRKQVELALRESQLRLEQYSEAQRQFVAEASHEIKTPIAGIQGNLEVLLRYPNIPEEEKREIVEDCHREAIRLGRLVSDLLGMARGNGEVLHLEDEVRLDQLLLDTLRDFESLKGNHTLQLGPLDTCKVLGDPGRLKQLLVILTGNALKYTPDGGSVSLSATCLPGQVTLRVSDTGIGIAPEDLERVFERFYRARSLNQASDPGGSGLGLSIARTIVHEHGGTIHLESEVGVGTTVVVTLPLHQEMP